MKRIFLFLILCTLLYAPCGVAQTSVRIDQLPEALTANGSDLLVIETDPSGAKVTEKIQFGNVMASPGPIGGTTAASGTFTTLTATDNIYVPMTGYGIKQTLPDPSAARNVIMFGNPTLNGVIDPTMVWGYNYDTSKPNHPKLYRVLEGNYYDLTHYISETYLQRYDSNGDGTRPFIIGTRDGWSEGALYLDSFTIANRAGTANALSYNATSDVVTVGATTTYSFIGNNRWALKQQNSGGAYSGLVSLNAADEVLIGEGLVGRLNSLYFGTSPNDFKFGVFASNVLQAGVTAHDNSATSLVIIGPMSSGAGHAGGILGISGGYASDYLSNGSVQLQPYGGAVTIGTAASGSLSIPKEKSATGTRYLCIDTNGLISSSALACSGT